MGLMIRLGLGVALMPLFSCGCLMASNLPPVTAVESVDLTRYAGTWYEIARYPVVFEEGCTGVTATYEIQDDGAVTVRNDCRQGSLDGPLESIVGRARVADDTGAKLKVSFFWPFEADYWVIDLDEDYEWAVVGEPGRRFLWILSREPSLSDEVVDGILLRITEQGYDPARLIWTEQTVGS